jgi:hypothetical protein
MQKFSQKPDHTLSHLSPAILQMYFFIINLYIGSLLVPLGLQNCFVRKTHHPGSNTSPPLHPTSAHSVVMAVELLLFQGFITFLRAKPPTRALFVH